MGNMSNAAHRLVFLTVNSSYSHSSLALPLLHSACCDLTSWEWFRYDMTNASDVISAVRDICDLHCDLLATDLYLFNRQTAIDVLQRIHTLQPECRIAVGGPECLGEGAEKLLQQYPFLDRIFRGEGLTHAEYTPEGFEKWIRVEITDAEGKQAWSNIEII